MFSPWQICSWPVWYFLAHGAMAQRNSTFIYFAQPWPSPAQSIAFKEQHLHLRYLTDDVFQSDW